MKYFNLALSYTLMIFSFCLAGCADDGERRDLKKEASLKEREARDLAKYSRSFHSNLYKFVVKNKYFISALEGFVSYENSYRRVKGVAPEYSEEHRVEIEILLREIPKEIDYRTKLIYNNIKYLAERQGELDEVEFELEEFKDSVYKELDRNQLDKLRSLSISRKNKVNDIGRVREANEDHGNYLIKLGKLKEKIKLLRPNW